MRTILFIDGSNLFGGISELIKPDQYVNFESFQKIIEKDFCIDEIKFYGTFMQINPLKSEAYGLRVISQKAFFDSAKNSPKVSFYKGNFSGAGKEKGIDVRLAVDIVIGACNESYNEAIIMTGDADLKYAVETAIKFGKKVHLAGFGSRYPFGIAPLTRKKYVYDLYGFFKNQIMSSYRRKPKDLVIREISQELSILTANKKPDGVRRGST